MTEIGSILLQYFTFSKKYRQIIYIHSHLTIDRTPSEGILFRAVCKILQSVNACIPHLNVLRLQNFEIEVSNIHTETDRQTTPRHEMFVAIIRI